MKFLVIVFVTILALISPTFILAQDAVPVATPQTVVDCVPSEGMTQSLPLLVYKEYKLNESYSVMYYLNRDDRNEYSCTVEGTLTFSTTVNGQTTTRTAVFILTTNDLGDGFIKLSDDSFLKLFHLSSDEQVTYRFRKGTDGYYYLTGATMGEGEDLSSISLELPQVALHFVSFPPSVKNKYPTTPQYPHDFTPNAMCGVLGSEANSPANCEVPPPPG